MIILAISIGFIVCQISGVKGKKMQRGYMVLGKMLSHQSILKKLWSPVDIGESYADLKPTIGETLSRGVRWLDELSQEI